MATTQSRVNTRLPSPWGVCALAMVAALLLLWAEPRVYVIGALPYVLLAVCALSYIFMHRQHGTHDHHEGSSS